MNKVISSTIDVDRETQMKGRIRRHLTYGRWEVGIDDHQPICMYYGKSEQEAIQACKSELTTNGINIRKEFGIPRGEVPKYIAVRVD